MEREEHAHGPDWGWNLRVARLLAGVTILAGLGLAIYGAGRLAPPDPPVVLRVDVNRAPVPLLTTLPGIGPGRARAILDARRSQPIVSPEDLEARVRGLGARTIDAIRPFLRFPDEPLASRE